MLNFVSVRSMFLSGDGSRFPLKNKADSEFKVLVEEIEFERSYIIYL